jgi:hypothetical protein
MVAMESWPRKFAIGGILLASAVLNNGCMADVGKPTDQEITQMQGWAEVVTPQDREVVTKEANQHTDWAERRKVQFITGEYKKRYLHEMAHPRTAHPATTKSSTSPVNIPGPGGL